MRKTNLLKHMKQEQTRCIKPTQICDTRANSMRKAPTTYEVQGKIKPLWTYCK